MMRHPYEHLPHEAFWSTAIAQCLPEEISGLYRPKWPISFSDNIACAGSCFAQRLFSQMSKSGLKIIDHEPAPPGLPLSERATFGYGQFSCRYGNIYSLRQLHQLVKEAAQQTCIDDFVWTRDDRYYDAFRPRIEPNGFRNADEAYRLRQSHLARVREMFLDLDVFVFTLGTNECWERRRDQIVFPTAPGVVAGDYTPETFQLRQFSFLETCDDLAAVLDLINQIRGGTPFRVILTVSPVPLTATATGQHILSANLEAKSLLRTVCGEFVKEENIDYFPGYEMILNPAAKAGYYKENIRNVSSEGIDLVMEQFFNAHGLRPSPSITPKPEGMSRDHQKDALDDANCEEEILEKFKP